MLFRDVADLIAVERGEDADGYDVETETRTEVFVDVRSVKRSEFYRSLQAGRKLDIAFLLRACDYDGQERVGYGGKVYRVVRDYSEDGETVELNCSEDRGESP